MKIRVLFLVLILSSTFALMVGCASTPTSSDATSTDVFPQPIEQVQRAAVDALAVTGFDVTKQEPTYIEGYRPRKMGLVVGSGGETVGIWLTEQGPNKTTVKVDTAKSIVGIAAQKDWDANILYEMTKSLRK